MQTEALFAAEGQTQLTPYDVRYTPSSPLPNPRTLVLKSQKYKKNAWQDFSGVKTFVSFSFCLQNSRDIFRFIPWVQEKNGLYNAGFDLYNAGFELLIGVVRQITKRQ